MRKLFLLSLIPVFVILFLVISFFILVFGFSLLREKAGKEFKFVPNDIAVTFPEGFATKEMELRLKENGFSIDFELNNESFEKLKNDFDFLKSVPIGVVSLEGFLFPDTYRFDKNASSREIIQKILANFDKKLNPELREEIKNQKKSVYEIITAASLIEEEGKSKEDREIISGVLWKRLEVGMPLQVDATINYITGKNIFKISIEETKIKSPYNTYLNKGLPKGPISNPGLESIKTAIYPKKTDYWYYLSTLDGKTIFSKNLEEHNIAKAKYLK